MAEPKLTRETLGKSRFFLSQAELAVDHDREAFVNNIEAAIVFGRSITFHMQKEYAHELGFDLWYQNERLQMGQDPLLKYFLEARNFILKQGPIPVRKIVHLHAVGGLKLSASIRAQVKRGKPWYRRSIKIIWEDTGREAIYKIRSQVMQPLYRTLRSTLVATQRALVPKRESVDIRDGYYFDDHKWGSRLAVDLIREYLDKIEIVVKAAEAKFAGSQQ